MSARIVTIATAISLVSSGFVPDATFGYVKKEGDFEVDEEMVGDFTKEVAPVRMKSEVNHRPKGAIREEGETVHRGFHPNAPVHDEEDFEKQIPEQARLKVGRSKMQPRPAGKPQAYQDEDHGEVQTIADFLHQDDMDDDDDQPVKATGRATINDIGVVSPEEDVRIDDRGAEDVLKRRRIRDLQATVNIKDGKGPDHQSAEQRRSMERIKKEALARTVAKKQEQEKVEAGKCPPVYVYDLPKELGGWKAQHHSLHDVFGQDLVGSDGTKSMAGAFSTPEDSLLRILLYRLRNSKECPQISDPNDAALYLVPLFPEADGPAWIPLCNTLKHTDWRRALPHLNKATAQRHIFVVPHNDNKGKIPCGDWWANPSPALLKNAIHLLVDSPAGDIPLPPHMLYVPRPASIHWASEFGADDAPWKKGKARRSLVSYFGGVHGPEGSRVLRKYLKDQCQKDKSCFMIVKESGQAKKELSKQYAAQVLRAKKESVFCLEPPGSTIGRKSIIDSLLMGCIPVLFDSKQDGLYPLHWSFKKYSRVLLTLDASCTVPFSKLTTAQKEDPTREDNCDVMRRLRQIPSSDVSHMQDVIAKYAHKMQYSLRDGIRSDAFEVLFTKIQQLVSEDAGFSEWKQWKGKGDQLNQYAKKLIDATDKTMTKEADQYEKYSNQEIEI
eukprot:gnl/MRDRNA2_/MRDRNA2_108288_c0_seq1.p1 gnl/MRDRNA2_/MRDRNA2_108288_c0~~gnl/MRDRNA2_/MRDRNA2_108288_c0_seq1.p1  ORF type:complete len:668 (+),score=154.48 gnl/MRDRNA2_/MRDRNA2_108288_c0_seq1:102-2105(+)